MKSSFRVFFAIKVKAIRKVVMYKYHGSVRFEVRLKLLFDLPIDSKKADSHKYDIQ